MTPQKKALQKQSQKKSQLHYKPSFWFLIALLILFITQHIFDPLIFNSGLIGGYTTAMCCACWGIYLLMERE